MKIHFILIPRPNLDQVHRTTHIHNIISSVGTFNKEIEAQQITLPWFQHAISPEVDHVTGMEYHFHIHVRDKTDLGSGLGMWVINC